MPVNAASGRLVYLASFRIDSHSWRKELRSKECLYLGEEETKKGVTEHIVFLGSEDNAVTPAFEDMKELRDHLANRGAGHGQSWSMGAVVLLEKHKKITREIGFIKPYNSNYRQQKETREVYQREFSKHLPAAIQQSALRKLRMLNNAQSVQDLRSSPGNRLEKLKGEREGQYSIHINDQWRVCFAWHKNDAYQVEITNDH